MKLSAKAEYALRAMIDLASRPGEQTTLEGIAHRQKIPVTILPNIIQTLARAGLVETLRGYRGGVWLGRPAEQINVRKVMEAIEGPLRLYRCDSPRGFCPLGLGEECLLRDVWEKTQGRVLEVWEEVSLADLADGHTQPARRKSPKRQSLPFTY